MEIGEIDMAGEKPVLSICVVVLNDRSNLSKTLQSLQVFPRNRLEVVIIDGGSKDGSVEVAEQMCQKHNHANVIVSEPDSGIFDAQNKALKLCNGSYVWFLNCGDVVARGFEGSKLFEEIWSADFWYGDIYVFTEGNIGNLVAAPNKLTVSSFKFGMPVSHQACIVRRSICSNYDLRYRYIADHLWLESAVKAARSVKKIDVPVCEYLLGGFSDKNAIKANLEKLLYLKKSRTKHVFAMSLLHVASQCLIILMRRFFALFNTYSD